MWLLCSTPPACAKLRHFPTDGVSGHLHTSVYFGLTSHHSRNHRRGAASMGDQNKDQQKQGQQNQGQQNQGQQRNQPESQQRDHQRQQGNQQGQQSNQQGEQGQRKNPSTDTG